MSSADPYLSIVVTSRNDDHGGDLLHRTQIFVNCLIAQCKRHGVAAELIFVEWNPPVGRPPLSQALKWPEDLGSCQVRFIEVPAAIHDGYKNAATLPLYQMIGKNVGIRRARAPFILATNIDILFSDELMRFIAARRLQSGHMYRIDRHDVRSEVPVDAAVDEQIEYCKNNLLRIHAAEGTFGFTPEGLRSLSTDDIADANSAILFGEGWFPVERNRGERFRWVNNDAKVTVTPPSRRHTTLLFELEPGPGVGSRRLDLCVVDGETSIAATCQVRGRSLVTLTLPEDKRALSFRLRALRGGKPVPHDPRTLNFRVFRCEWIESKLENPRGLGYTLHARPAVSFFTRSTTLSPESKEALMRVADVPDVSWELPAPRRVRLFLRFVWQAESLSRAAFCAVRLAFRRYRLSARVPSGQDIAGGASGIDLGAGWEPLEDHLGETFRWVGAMCELLIRIPQAPPRNLLLQLEEGPSAGKKGVPIRIEDESGAELRTITVRRIQLISVPLRWEPGRTKIIRLRTVGAGNPVPGDGRVLNFRAFWVGWSTSVASSTPDLSSRSLGLVESPKFVDGVAWGHGWSDFQRDDLGDLYRQIAGESGEILIRLPSPSSTDLGADLRLADAAVSGPCTLQILDTAGRPILTTPLGEGMHRLSLPAKTDETSVYRIRCVDDQEKALPLRAYGFRWCAASPDETAALRRSPGAPAISLHTNACGDFTLMAKEHWFDVRAYPEWDLYSFHIDSTLCYAAHHSGALETVLKEPMRIYHIEHGRGSGWTPEGESQLFERLRAKKVSWIEYPELVTWIEQMRRLDCPMIFNRENWGLADFHLPETSLDNNVR
jgi:hypothetical protein